MRILSQCVLVFVVSGALAAHATEPASPNVTDKATKPEPIKTPAGYRARKIEGNTLYCKTTQILGSRLPKTICLTADEISLVQKNTDSAMTDMNQKMSVCVDPNSCGSP
jgi:hypothetical protein